MDWRYSPSSVTFVENRLAGIPHLWMNYSEILIAPAVIRRYQSFELIFSEKPA